MRGQTISGLRPKRSDKMPASVLKMMFAMPNTRVAPKDRLVPMCSTCDAKVVIIGDT